MCSCRLRPACCSRMIWSTPAASNERTWAAEVGRRADAARLLERAGRASVPAQRRRRARRSPRCAWNSSNSRERPGTASLVTSAEMAKRKNSKPSCPRRDGLGRVVVQREGRHHGDVGVDAVAERHAGVALDDVVVDLAPGARLRLVEEGEGQRAEPEARRDLDGVAVGAGHPHRRMRLLHGLRDDVAAGHLERAALEARVGRHHHHVGDLLGGLERHGALLLGRDVEAAELEPRRALADAELGAAVGDEVEHGDGLGRARGVVVVGDHLADAVAEPDALGARGGGGQEHLGGRAVRVLLEEVVLDRPGVVEPEPVGELDLGERVLHQLLLVVGSPGLGQLQLVEDAEFHFAALLTPPSSTPRRRRRA